MLVENAVGPSGVLFLEEFIEAVGRQKQAARHATEGEGGVALPVSAKRMSDLALHLEAALVFEKRGSCCLPIAEAIRLQDVAQRAWNATTEADWPQGSDGADAKCLHRLLVVHCYLLSINFFAPAKRRSEYLSHHPRETEKAVLMCVKTAKALASAQSSETKQRAVQLLEFARSLSSGTVAAAVGGRGDLSSTLHLEVMFTSLSVHWELGFAQQAVDIATDLRREVAGSAPYRESFLQLVFSMAERREEQSAKLAECDERNHGAGTDLSQDAALQRMLDLSLQLQEVGTQTVQKRRALRGTTLLQLASAQCRTSNFTAAAANAQSAHEELQSLEPLVLLVQIYAKQADKLVPALEQFREITKLVGVGRRRRKDGLQSNPQDEALSAKEILSLAAVLTDAAQSFLSSAGGDALLDLSDAVTAAAVEALSPASLGPEEARKARRGLVAFLLHVHTDASLRRVCALLEEWCACPSSQAESSADDRFFFCACWSAGSMDNASRTSPESVPCETRYRCLAAALLLAPIASNALETEGVLVKMAELALVRFQQDARDEGPLRTCLSLLEQRPHRSLCATLALCQLVFTLEPERARGVHFAAQLLTPASTATLAEAVPPPVIAAAFGTLVNYLLCQNLIMEAGQVAAMAAGVAPPAPGVRSVPLLTDEERLPFLRVCADAFLVRLTASRQRVEEGHSSDLAAMVTALCQHALELLSRAVERCVTGGACTNEEEEAGAACAASPLADLTRWCQLLWFFATDVVALNDAKEALRIHSGAIEMFRLRCCDYGDVESKRLLVNSVLYALGLEFDLFVSESSVLSVDTLATYLSLVKECSRCQAEGKDTHACAGQPASHSAAAAATIALAEAEGWLRVFAEHGGPTGAASAHATGISEADAEATPAAAGAKEDEDRCRATADPEGNPPYFPPVSQDALVAAGVAAAELEALAVATGTIAAALGQHTVLTRLAVDLELLAVSTLVRQETPADPVPNTDGNAPQQAGSLASRFVKAAAMTFRAYQLASGCVDLQRRATEALVDLIQAPCARASAFPPPLPRGPTRPHRWEAPAAATDSVRECSGEGGADAHLRWEEGETVLEFFAVEAWNTAVGLHALRDPAAMSHWRALALSVSSALPEDNRVRQAIADYSQRMPNL